MKVKAGLISLVFILSFLPFWAFSQETLTITTYYPSPYGSYQDLVVNRRLALGNDGIGSGAGANWINEAITGTTDGINNSDAAIFVPVYTGVEISDLRLYIVDNPDDSFSIWGWPCQVAGGCGSLNNASIVAKFAANGNVGIGTTNTGAPLVVMGTKDIDTTLSPNPLCSHLKIYDNVAYNANPRAGISFAGRWNSAGNNVNFGGIHAGKDNVIDGDYGGYLAFFTRQNGIGWPEERIRIASSGYVGIGTANPAAPFHVANTNGAVPAGCLDGYGGVASNSGIIWLRNAGGTPASPSATTVNGNAIGILAFRGRGSSNWVNGASARISAWPAENFTDAAAGGYITFDTAAAGTTAITERVRISDIGNVGIGTASPDAKLAVGTKITAEALNNYATRISNNTAGSGNNGLVIETQDNSGSGNYLVRGYSNSNRVFTIDKQGQMRIGGSGDPGGKFQVVGLPTAAGNTVTCNISGGTATFSYVVSARRYKDNIQPLQEDFSKILGVSPKSFIYKSTGQPDIGYIAEDFEEMGLKKLLNYNQEGQLESIKYEKISLYLIEIIKNQQTELDSIKKELAELKQKIK